MFVLSSIVQPLARVRRHVGHWLPFPSSPSGSQRRPISHLDPLFCYRPPAGTHRARAPHELWAVAQRVAADGTSVVVPATAILPFAAAATGPLTQGPSPAPVAGCDVARPCCLRRVPLDEGTEFAIAPLEGGPGAASSYHSVRCRWCRSSRERMTGAAFPASVLTANDFVGVSEMAMLLPSTDLVSGAGGTTSLPPMGGTTKRISRSFSGIADG